MIQLKKVIIISTPVWETARDLTKQIPISCQPRLFFFQKKDYRLPREQPEIVGFFSFKRAQKLYAILTENACFHQAEWNWYDQV